MSLYVEGGRKVKEIIVYTNVLTDEFFFTTDHCQKVREDGKIHGNQWVPATYTLPRHVKPRKGCESGIVETVEEWMVVHGPKEKEIPNPNEKYTPIWNSSSKALIALLEG